MERGKFDMLIRAHQGEIYQYVRYLGGDRDSAEDLVQETFLVAFEKLPGQNQVAPGVEAAWLRGVARNLFLQHCRKTKRDGVVVDGALLEQAETVWTAEYLRGGDGSDYAAALRQCMAELSEDQRRALEMRYRDGRSRADMAVEYGMTEDGIKSLLVRIRAGLAESIRRKVKSEEAGAR